jgi:transcriptional regulator with XRE-family HTH domain
MDENQEDTKLAQFLRVERAKRNVSQTQAANECGVHWRTWSIWETKPCRPSVDMCQLIAKWAGIETGTLIDTIIVPAEEVANG